LRGGVCIEESEVKGFYLSSRYVVDQIGESNQSVPVRMNEGGWGLEFRKRVWRLEICS
jgi:hypothetical protein